MATQISIVNNHPVITTTESTGIPISGRFGQFDILASNAAILAKSGLTRTFDANPTINDDAIGTAGNGIFNTPSF